MPLKEGFLTKIKTNICIYLDNILVSIEKTVDEEVN